MLKKLIQSETKVLRAFFYYKTSSNEVAEDLYQELMIKLVKSEALASVDDPKSYVFRAASNLVKDHYRRRSTERSMLEGVQHGPQEKHNSITAERILEGQQKYNLVEQALTELPVQCVAIFRRVKIDGQKQKDVAIDLGISIRTVETNLRKALIHCQKRLLAHGLDQ
ncbi:MAG: RNA polymerase sigma factor [Kordiimonadaceae bacterium]|nr:RNA polymerase sigma factor [Kordiimonadaceae bacterium]